MPLDFCSKVHIHTYQAYVKSRKIELIIALATSQEEKWIPLVVFQGKKLEFNAFIQWNQFNLLV